MFRGGKGQSLNPGTMQCFHKSREVEELWREFFANPNQWKDLRAIKRNKKFPDFVHRTTKKALWIDGWQNPFWVGAELDKLIEDAAAVASFNYRLASGNTIRKLLKDGRLIDAFQAADIANQHGSLISTSIAFCLLQACIDHKDLAIAKKLHGFLESHVELGRSELAVTLYHQMQQSYVEADEYLFVAVLRACTSLEALTEGKLIHTHIILNGLEVCIHVGSALVDMYSKCGSFEDGQTVLFELPKPSVVTWNALIGGCAQRGNGHEALLLFDRMQQCGCKPNAVTFVCVLQACSNIASIQEGMLAHGSVMESNFESDAFVGSILIDMYARCGSLPDAQSVFEKLPKDDLVTWSAMMTGYAHHGQGDELLSLFEQLVQEGIEPNDGIFVSVLKACTCTSTNYYGNYVHEYIVESGYDIDECISSMLIDMHVKHGSLKDARSVFANVTEQGVVPWTSMMVGYSQHGHGQETLRLFERMQQEAQVPNLITFISALNACSSIAAIFWGKLVHASLIASGSGLEEVAGIALINMYKNCGSLTSATIVFHNLPNHSIEVWTAIIVACAEHNDFKLALSYFENMKQRGLKPDDITFISLLSACCHGGQVYDGCLLFRSLVEKHFLALKNDHYNSMVSLLGSSGYLVEAEDLLLTMPTLPNVVGWTALLTHCKTHNSAELGGRCFAEMAPVQHSAYEWHE